MCIKNENDVGPTQEQTMSVATTVVTDLKGLSAGMTPFVSLTRLSPALLRRNKDVVYLGDG